MTIILIWIIGALIVIGFLTFFYKIIKSSVLNEDKKKRLVKDFVQTNKNLTLKEINVAFHKMYNSMDNKLKNAYPVDVLWQSVLTEFQK